MKQNYQNNKIYLQSFKEHTTLQKDEYLAVITFQMFLLLVLFVSSLSCLLLLLDICEDRHLPWMGTDV